MTSQRRVKQFYEKTLSKTIEDLANVGFVVRHFCQLIRIHKDTRFMNRELYGLEETLSNYFNQLGEICIILCWGSQQNLHE